MCGPHRAVSVLTESTLMTSQIKHGTHHVTSVSKKPYNALVEPDQVFCCQYLLLNYPSDFSLFKSALWSFLVNTQVMITFSVTH